MALNRSLDGRDGGKEQLQERFGALRDALPLGSQHEFRVLRRLVRIRDAGEPADLASHRFRVEPFGIALSAHVKRRVEKDLEERNAPLATSHDAARLLPIAAVWRDQRCYGN